MVGKGWKVVAAHIKGGGTVWGVKYRGCYLHPIVGVGRVWGDKEGLK